MDNNYKSIKESNTVLRNSLKEEALNLSNFSTLILSTFNLFLLLITFALISCDKKVKEETDPNVFYTCSMDPQVMEKKPGKCPICKMELTRTVITPHTDKESLKLSKEQIQLANIETGEAGYASIGEGMSLRGTLATDESKVEIISSRVRGRVDKLYFKNPGERINKGDVVYEIYSEELQAAVKQYLLVREKFQKLDGSKIDYRELLSAAKNKLLVWGLSERQIEKLNDASASGLLSFYSKVSGTVNEIFITEGEYVDEGSSILTISDYATLWVEAEAYPSDMKNISAGTTARVTVEGFPGDVLEGKISFENPELEKGSRIALLRVQIDNAERKFQPGMRASVTIMSAEKRALLIAESAVLYEPRMNTVWVMKADGSFSPRMVELGTKSGGLIEVKSGLAEGDTVVTSGAYLLNSEYILRKGSSAAAMGHQH